MQKVYFKAESNNGTLTSGKMAQTEDNILLCLEILNEFYMDSTKTIFIENEDGSIIVLHHAGEGEYI